MAKKVLVAPAMFDLEMTNLAANFGRLICGSIYPYGAAEPTTYRIDQTESGRREVWNDRDLAVQLRDAIEDHFLVISYNGVMFDLKFLNSRLLHYGERPMRFPMHKDLLFVAKWVFALSNNTLQSVQDHLGLVEKKTRLHPGYWNRAAGGDPEAIQYIVEHCEQDVKVLAEVFEHLAPFVKEIHA